MLILERDTSKLHSGGSHEISPREFAAKNESLEAIVSHWLILMWSSVEALVLKNPEALDNGPQTGVESRCQPTNADNVDDVS